MRLGEQNVGGSSPLARGALSVDVQDAGFCGIIPACAGSTRLPKKGETSDWDHPRLRGEHAFPLAKQKLAEGSSPLARGALFAEGAGVLFAGIIPACAGSTLADQAKCSCGIAFPFDWIPV